jgi:N-acyl-D-aspartate/D-glutamate deacylase
MRLIPGFLLSVALLASGLSAQTYDIVIANGRVIDPESKLDAIRNVGISGGAIRAVSESPLQGRTTVDARGLVVAPGFIDLHSHGQDAENYRYKAADGVTTALELEVGVGDVDAWYAERAGRALINYGASAGHIPQRIRLMNDPSPFLPSGPAAHRAATPSEIEQMKRGLRHGLERGGVGAGFGVMYTEAASYWEILEMFRVAGEFHAPSFVHMRYAGALEPGGVRGLSELLTASLVGGGPLHLVHLNSMSLRLPVFQQMIQMIEEARKHGLDVTTEAYPYTASQTRIESAIFDEGWQQRLGITYKDLEWPDTGERLTAETFAKYRKTGGSVIPHNMDEETIRAAMAHPLVMIASDGAISGGKGHPRGAGTFARVLGVYVREQHALTLNDAIAKMTLMPVQRLETIVPGMKNKGRIRVGADADVTVFDPASVIDRATFANPTLPSEGFRCVLVNGEFVLRDGKLIGDAQRQPGQPVRGAIR